MSILDVLPVVDKCCCFSLRTGSVLIAIWNIFVVVCHASASVAYHSACKRTKSDIPHNIMYAIEWISIVLDVLVFIASIILLIGIFYDCPVDYIIDLFFNIWIGQNLRNTFIELYINGFRNYSLRLLCSSD
ncbi:uncharacterized protein LOC131847826 isoform X2 [Achroia grisella]|uniref:uncharacterized protein LOC131847826 isoform X2 n=1 Tax=Achroia grisella TaxID=688607 RepID=UPI0027D21298|nr:uncharacterized protein LOC131847826 isoform X2 [Achroia grisella]